MTSGSRQQKIELLQQLFDVQLAIEPDSYIEQHRSAEWIRGSEQVFAWYSRFVARDREHLRILDWGCRHGPDSALLVHEFGELVELNGCDVVEDGSYKAFRDYSGMRYTKLAHEYELPYDSGSFDVVIAAGVLEHVPMQYESLRELSRVTKHRGILIISYLPNRWSIHEFILRRRTSDIAEPGRLHHLRRYDQRSVSGMLSEVGFQPVEIGYQTHFDLLPLEPAPTGRRRCLSKIGRVVGASRVAPCLAVVARRLDSF